MSRSRRSSSPVPGQLLGNKYRIEARVAEGGMSVVLRATHLDLDCPVAIKLIRPEYADNEDVIARLLTEARIAGGLRSKHVNHVLDVGRTAHGLPYLVLEYMEGSDLRGYLERRGSLPIGEAADCVMQTCEALAEAHAFGIVHRDLKPENLFLCEDADGGFVLKVLDFGISKAPAARRGGRTLTNPFEVVGSPNYMAPEQIRGDSVDSRADIWALGVLLYELCSGQVPFAAETVTETFALILDPNYELPPVETGMGSDHLEQVIRRCLRKNPDERYQSVVELADALSPLGSDPGQGKRVAKVAIATRARVIAAGERGKPVGTDTPLALSTGPTPLPTASAPAFRRQRPGLKWLAAGALVAGMSALGFRMVTPGAAPAAQAQPAIPAEASPKQAAPAAALDDSAAIPVAISPLPPAPTASASVTPTVTAPPKAPARSWRPRPAVPDYGLSAAPLTATAAPADAPAPASEAEPDAWDPKTFGGRR